MDTFFFIAGCLTLPAGVYVGLAARSLHNKAWGLLAVFCSGPFLLTPWVIHPIIH